MRGFEKAGLSTPLEFQVCDFVDLATGFSSGNAARCKWG